jgi:tRNA pseudouridine38-40 synthase
MPKKRNLKLVVEYDGTRYFGWQIQKDKPSIQGELERAVLEVTRHASPVVGAGRTDAGVHAEGQVANVHTQSPIPARKWPDALNARLGEDIAVLSAEDVPPEFHAQYAATSKLYRYRVLNLGTRSALDRLRTHLVRPPLDVEALQAAARALAGTHDFRSFGSEMSKKEHTVRTILSFEVVRHGAFVDFLVHGDGFLYNQVRSMVGTLIPVGLGMRPAGWVKEVLEARDRSKAGVNVPAKGLTLVEVRFDGTPRRRPQDAAQARETPEG